MKLLPVASDSTAGTVGLRWGRYRGPGFEVYQIRRREVGTTEEEVLSEVVSVTDTSFVDEDILAGVTFVYTIAVRAADRELVSNGRESRLILPPVQILDLDLNSATAAATVEWSAYTGPRFHAYQVRRRAEGEISQVVEEIENRAVTRWRTAAWRETPGISTMCWW